MAPVINFLYLARTLLRVPRMALVSPALNLFFLRYIGNFRIKNSAGHWTVHSHLPPLNHPAFGRFVSRHLLERSIGPSHAQIGLTNACPQACAYCYNRERRGQAMDTATILRAVRELQELGVCWLGLTGGEPLLNPDIARIVASAADGCAVKLFTTGSTLTSEKARELKQAGLFSVSVSLDHWLPEIHDRNRGLAGAFATALNAIRLFRETGGIQVGVSAVVSRDMIRDGQVEEFLEFLQGLGIDEAWLCEAKPSVAAFWDEGQLIGPAELRQLSGLQDRRNRRAGMTVNFLGHFESREHFGCNAGAQDGLYRRLRRSQPLRVHPHDLRQHPRPLPERDLHGDEVPFPLRRSLLHQPQLPAHPRRRPRPGLPRSRRLAPGHGQGRIRPALRIFSDLSQ